VAADLATAEAGDVTAGVLLTGMLEPAVSVTVTAQAAGTVRALSADRGTVVRSGAPLATLTADGIRSNAAGAVAAVAAAEANLAVARTRRDAAERLYAAGATSRVDAENAKAVYAAAEAQVAAARAQLAAAEEQSSFTAVTAPIAGTVSARMIESGQAVRVGDALFTVVSTSTLELAGRVPVDQAAGIRVGQSVRFVIDAFPDREFTGRVDRKDPVADPSSRQVGVWVRIPNADGRITAGQYGRGEVAGQTVKDAVRVPATAVVGEGEGAHVFVLAGDQLVRRAVVVGVRDVRAGLVAITSGVSAGERVLARPTPGLLDTQTATIAGER
jgi:RND family efflux transporter MFP subunit